MFRKLAALLLLTLVVAACSPAKVEVPPASFTADDVQQLEMYVYRAGEQSAHYVTLDGDARRMLTELFTPPELFEPTDAELDFAGREVTALRVHLADGTVWERSHVFFGPGAVFVDASGRPLGTAKHSSLGTLPMDGATVVDVAEAPPIG